jgi:hypothetical protein
MRNFLYLLGALAAASLMAALLPALAQTATPAATENQRTAPVVQHKLDQNGKEMRGWSGPRNGG